MDIKSGALNRDYWDNLADQYQSEITISVNDYHYGPLIPGDKELGLLPSSLQGKRCLEIGCGAAQNSIYLARQGADCCALDISEAQLEHGRRLATQHQVELQLLKAELDHMPLGDLGTFDLIHSSYALPFADDPAQVIQDCATLLKPGGVFLASVGHPAFSGEWVELEENDTGLFIRDYFRPPADVRTTEDGSIVTWAKSLPLSRTSEALHAAGLQLDRMLEPQPLPVITMKHDEILNRVPYYSEDWKEMFHELNTIPIVAIFRATKP